MMQKKNNYKVKGFRSNAEENFADDLSRRGIEWEFERYTYKYGVLVRAAQCQDCLSKRVRRLSRYTPDFRINDTYYVETKGRLTSRDRTKLLAVKEGNPDLDLRLVFFANNKLNKNSKTRYSDWAEKHGFLYYVGKFLPDEWA